MNTRPSSSPVHIAALAVAASVAVLGSSSVAQTSTVDASLERVVRELLEEAQKKEVVAKTTLIEDHSTWDKAWRIPSAHFEVWTTQPYSYGSQLASGVEQMSAIMEKLAKPGFAWPEQKLQIHLHPDVNAYNGFGNSSGADEHSSFYGSFYAPAAPGKPVAASFKANGTLVWMEVTHSVTHQFLDHAYPGSQRAAWMEEGLASYMALHWNFAWGKSELARIQTANRWVPVFQLLRNTTARYGRRAHEHLIELGMLFNYLLNFHPETKSPPDEKGVPQGPFAEYLRKSLRGEDVTNHPVHAILFVKTKQLEDGLKACKF